MVNQLKWGSFLSYMQMGISMIINLTYTHIMTRLLGQSEYGLYNTVSSTIAILSIISLGFGSSYIRYYAKYKAAKDNESVYRLNGLFLIIFCIIGLIALTCGLFISNNLHLIFDKGLTVEEYHIAKVLTILFTLNLTLSFPASVFSNIILAHEKYIFSRTVAMVKTVMSPLITLPLLLAGFRSIAMVSVALCLSIIADAINIYYTFFKIKEKFVFRNFEKGLFKSLFIFTSFIAINSIVGQINWNVGKLLLGRHSGTTAVAIYSVGYTLYHIYETFSSSISGVFSPRIHMLARKNADDPSILRKSFTDLFTKVGRIQFLLLGLVCSGIVFFGKQFIVKCWVGPDYEQSYYIAIMLIIPASIPLLQNIGIEMQRALNLHKFRTWVYLGMAILNVIITNFACQKYGAIGATFGTALSVVVANGIIINIYYHKRCDIDIIFFWKNILRMSIGLIPPIFIGILINHIVVINNFFDLLLAAILYALCYSVSMWFISMNTYEKGLVITPLKKFLRK